MFQLLEVETERFGTVWYVGCPYYAMILYGIETLSVCLGVVDQRRGEKGLSLCVSSMGAPHRRPLPSAWLAEGSLRFEC